MMKDTLIGNYNKEVKFIYKNYSKWNVMANKNFNHPGIVN